MLLTSARNQYVEQQRIAAAGLSQARKRATRGPVAVAAVVARYQAASILLSLQMAPDVLAEQGIATASQGRVSTESLLTGAATTDLLNKAETDKAFDRLVLSLIADAGRTAQSVDNATRPAVTGYVRSLSPPSCSRCAVLAGRVYRYSQGFQRHPRCDCLMTPTTLAAGRDLVTDGTALAMSGGVRKLSRAEVDALEQGADLGQIVNVGRKQAGLRVGSSVIERAGRPTPAGIYRIATDKAEALALFRRFGYVL